MRSWIAAVGVALVLGTSTAVLAQSATPDLVVLSSGGRVRGVVTDYEPGVRVVVQMPDGTSRTYPGSEIAGVTFGDTMVTPPSAPPVSLPPTAPVAVPAETSATPPAPAATRWSTPRSFQPAHAREWTNSAREWTERRPRGPFHFGLQLEGTGLIGFRDAFKAPAFTIGGGVAGFFEVTLGMTGTLRVGLSLSLSPSFHFQYAECRLGSGCDEQAYETRSVTVGGRVLLGTDFGAGFFRVGIDGSAAVVRSGVGMELGARIELGGRLLPSRSLELGAGLGLGVTTFARQYDTYGDGPWNWAIGMMFPRIDVFVGWVFE